MRARGVGMLFRVSRGIGVAGDGRPDRGVFVHQVRRDAVFGAGVFVVCGDEQVEHVPRADVFVAFSAVADADVLPEGRVEDVDVDAGFPEGFPPAGFERGRPDVGFLAVLAHVFVRGFPEGFVGRCVPDVCPVECAHFF